MKISKRYSSLAKYYDFIYKDKDYRSDANFVKKLITKYKKSSGNHLLEVACGTGRFLEFFQDSFVCTGLDNSREMLRLAKKKNLKAKLVLEDMGNFCLSEQYDVVLCLFGSISLVLNQENLQKTLSRLVAATKLGGLLVIEPFFSQQTYAQRKTPKVAVSANDSITLVRLSKGYKKEGFAFVDLHYIISDGNKTSYHREKYRLGLFASDDIVARLKKMGVRAKYDSKGFSGGHGVIYGVRQV